MSSIPQRHLWTTNVVDSPFDAVHLRTTAVKRFKTVVYSETIGELVSDNPSQMMSANDRSMRRK